MTTIITAEDVTAYHVPMGESVSGSDASKVAALASHYLWEQLWNQRWFSEMFDACIQDAEDELGVTVCGDDENDEGGRQ